jgi:hypothetical protein
MLPTGVVWEDVVWEDVVWEDVAEMPGAMASLCASAHSREPGSGHVDHHGVGACPFTLQPYGCGLIF